MGIPTLTSLIALTLGASLLATACSETTGGTLIDTEQLALLSWNGDARLERSLTCAQASARYRTMAKTEMRLALEQQRRYEIAWRTGDWDQWGWGWGMEADGAVASADASGGEGAQSGPSSYTDTNVQVEGVDEADLVKTDGKLIYAIMGGDLVVVRSWPVTEAAELGRTAIRGNPYAIHRYGETLVVLSRASLSQLASPDDQKTFPDQYGYYWHPATVASIVDVSDPAKPQVERVHVTEGWQISSRRIGSEIYMVQSKWTWVDGLVYWANDLAHDATVAEVNRTYAELAQENEALIDEMDIQDVLPRRWNLGADEFLQNVNGEVMTECSDFYAPRAYSGHSLLTIATLDLDDGKLAKPKGTTVVGEWGNVYASTEALYVASTNWGWNWWYDGDFDVQTRIHKFGLDTRDGVAPYRASGKAPGYTLNQFSMDEFQGRLRVATTDPVWWWMGGNEAEQSESFITVLNEVGTVLYQEGQAGEIGLGEQIFSVRFMGNKGYVVTFRQTDPLFVLDLRNHKKPAVTGELEIPGFSAYMHPLDSHHLLTIGRDGNEDGLVAGLSFQIFDVTDPTAPKLAHKTTLGDTWGTWSEALYDHHAFTYYPDKGLLGVPVSRWGMMDCEECGLGETGEAIQQWGFSSELTLFHVDLEAGVSPAGSIDHEPLLEGYDDISTCWGWYAQQAQIRRSIFMDDYIFSVSTVGIRVHESEALEAGAIADLPLLDPSSMGDGYANGCYW